MKRVERDADRQEEIEVRRHVGDAGQREERLRVLEEEVAVFEEPEHAQVRGEAGDKPGLGARLGSAADGVKLTHVLDGGGAQEAGLSAGDLLIAVDRLKVSLSSLETLLGRRRAGNTVTVHAFRRDELIEREVRLSRAEVVIELKPEARVGGAAARLRRAWLHT